MQKYIQSLASQTTGIPLPNIKVTIQSYPSGTPVTVYATNDFTQPITQPLITGGNGQFSFYAIDGHYQATATPPGLPPIITDFIIQDLLDETTFVSTALLATSAGAGMVGSTAGNVQTDINARPTSATLSASSGSSLVGFQQAGTGAVARTVQAKEQDIISSVDYPVTSNFNTALAALTPTIGIQRIKIGDSGMFGYTDNAVDIQSYGDTGPSAPTGIQQANRFIARSKGDNATFRGLSTGYFEARDRDDVTALNKGVLYALSLSVVTNVARNNVPYDDVAGLTISNTTGMVGAKGTDAIYLSNNTTAFGDTVTGTSQWYSIFTADCNADVGIALNGKIAAYGIDLNLANLSTGAAIRFPNNSSLYWRNNTFLGDLPVIGLDSNNVINLGGTNVSGVSVRNWFGTTAPSVQGAATYSVGFNDNYLIFNGSGCTVTLPAAGSFYGRQITLKTTTNFAVISNASNVVPLAGGTVGTAILAGTAGKWAKLVSDGANWQIMEGN